MARFIKKNIEETPIKGIQLKYIERKTLHVMYNVNVTQLEANSDASITPLQAA